ncbi:hypothetical protein NADFUDRAFT_83707 [Nadsonia fulvescens var. elongata DSM 6958]|uniref:Coenzyme Q-binding protein COQ10 START domain-containing protein n=1 Tax=Nadsonia fulvescens var. elongata DSM 6958 TaxID=857566 RepID=A0A1E3PG00_9ASCO|nr:hypothetical protein NADFUDRAFT_83707 [Nadsonia fulvescens var. elongata DSM 6958]
MYHITTSINITSTPEKVRAAILDFDSYPSWNPFMRSIKITKEPSSKDRNILDETEFRPFVGSVLDAHFQPINSNKPMNFTPIVLRNDHKCFKWKGNLISDWFFAGTHYFKFEVIDEKTVKFIQAEDFTGTMVFILKFFLGGTKESFEAMNLKLKEKVESMEKTV